MYRTFFPILFGSSLVSMPTRITRPIRQYHHDKQILYGPLQIQPKVEFYNISYTVCGFHLCLCCAVSLLTRLWISQITSKRASLEDKDLQCPIILPEIIHFELALGQLSPQECNTFAVTTLGDKLHVKNKRGRQHGL